ncbi:hypothetical protein CKAH01_04163 [Colletotrichum kahawae]|uniref:Uncharacterized protein n=1 Tax=Colletotrichum kahawae TaxID=34407 RepID=A0AAE0DAD9_COLKA|nr:hypothetical protein CKAH01_04163 [Colletotrichum kahawae]
MFRGCEIRSSLNEAQFPAVVVMAAASGGQRSTGGDRRRVFINGGQQAADGWNGMPHATLRSQLGGLWLAVSHKLAFSEPARALRRQEVASLQRAGVKSPAPRLQFCPSVQFFEKDMEHRGRPSDLWVTFLEPQAPEKSRISRNPSIRKTALAASDSSPSTSHVSQPTSSTR